MIGFWTLTYYFISVWRFFKFFVYTSFDSQQKEIYYNILKKLLQDTCTLAFYADNTNFVDDGWYAAALTIEDFPKAPMLIGNTSYNTSAAITAVPVQVHFLSIFNIS